MVVVVVVVVVGPSTHSPYPIPFYPVPPPSPSVSSILLFHHLPDPALGVPAITLTNLASALFSFSRSFPSFLFLFPDFTSCLVSFPLLDFASIQFSCIQFFFFILERCLESFPGLSFAVQFFGPRFAIGSYCLDPPSSSLNMVLLRGSPIASRSQVNYADF